MVQFPFIFTSVPTHTRFLSHVSHFVSENDVFSKLFVISKTNVSGAICIACVLNSFDDPCCNTWNLLSLSHEVAGKTSHKTLQKAGMTSYVKCLFFKIATAAIHFAGDYPKRIFILFISMSPIITKVVIPGHLARCLCEANQNRMVWTFDLLL